MNRKNRGLTLAALLGIFLFALTCGAALAESPVFYVKIANKADNPVHVHWYWTTRAGANPGSTRVTVIQAHETTTFHGLPGQGRMQAWTITKGEDAKKVHMDGDTNPNALNASYYIKYNKEGNLRIYKPNG